MAHNTCLRCVRQSENSAVPAYAMWTGGVVATLGIGAAILAGAGIAAADATSGSESSAPSTSSATRASVGPTAGATHRKRSARTVHAAAATTDAAAVADSRPVVVRAPQAPAPADSGPPGTSTALPVTFKTATTAKVPVKSPPTVPPTRVTTDLASTFQSVQVAPVSPIPRIKAAAAAAPRTGPGTWGAPTRSVYFTDSSVLSQFVVYTGQTPNGTRTPSALSFSNGTMTITGDAAGNDEGIAWTPGQKYGAWEVRLRVPPGAKNYDPVLLLWPDAENWPKGGEVDFMEMWDDPTRQKVNSVLHYGPSDKQVRASMAIDATQWHTYAVKWTPTQITTYADGVPLFTSTNKSTFPPAAMHLCIQLDTQGTDIAAGGKMEVAWAKQYSLTAVT
jgi:Glycosyl hydrolases family 16